MSALRRFTTVFGTGTGGPTAHCCTRTYACSPINRIPAGEVCVQVASDESGTAWAGRAGLRGGDGVRPRRRWALTTERLGLPREKNNTYEQGKVRKSLGRWRTSQLRRLRGVHLSPLVPVVYWGPYQLKAGGWAILGSVSRLDAFSASPVRTWLPGDAPGGTAYTPAVRPPRSSRTRGGSPHPSGCPRRIETELSHDVLNPARVPL